MVQRSAPKNRTSIQAWRVGFGLVVVVAVLIVVVPKATDLHAALKYLRQADAVWVAAAVVGLLVTYIVAALIYHAISLKPLRYRQTVAVQMASMFASRILPAGLGALGVNYLYLRRRQHTAAQAGAIITINNLLGFAGNALLVVLALLTTTVHLPRWPITKIAFVTGGVIALVLGTAYLLRSSRRMRTLRMTMVAVGTAFLAYRRRPGRLLGGLMFSMLLTCLYAIILLTSAKAIGPELSLGTALIVMTIGVAGATVTPTPGGVGGAEAALAAALVLYGIPSAQAVATAVVYRLVTYWLGLIVGAGALLVARRSHYI